MSTIYVYRAAVVSCLLAALSSAHPQVAPSRSPVASQAPAATVATAPAVVTSVISVAPASGNLINLSAITEWTGMGDSYSTGIGAGTRFSNSSTCFLFSGGYDNLLQNALQPRPAKFNWPACSGDLFPAILENQLRQTPPFFKPWRGVWGDKPSVVTINLGGNDIGFKELVTRCIYGIQVFTLENCDYWITESQRRVATKSYLEDGAFNVLSKILDQAVTRGSPDFRIFVLGYAQFFNNDTTQCDNVQGLPAPRLITTATPKNLTRDVRQTLNTLARDLNSGIQRAVTRAATRQLGQVTYVPIDDLFANHRFCDRTEPNYQDPLTWFFTFENNATNTQNNGLEALTKAIPAITTTDANGRSWTNSTEFYEYVNNHLNQTDDSVLDDLAKLARVFHPKLDAQSMIQQRLLTAINGYPPVAIV